MGGVEKLKLERQYINNANNLEKLSLSYGIHFLYLLFAQFHSVFSNF